MKREEERKQAAENFLDKNKNIYFYADAFEGGAVWADEHPRKGLVDIDKVCKWLEKGGYFVNNTETIEDFRNAMMNENTSIIDEEKIMEDLVKFKHGN